MTLTIDRITKSYGTNRALDSFTAELTPGIYALLGPNGSGKSTLMNIITDNLKADSGTITYDGENVLQMGERFREKLGFMPQYPGLYPNFSVERFLWYMAALKGMTKEAAMEQIPAVLAAVELDDVPGRRIGALSGGMKQRLALAQAVLGDPEVLILDEPTAGLDPKQRIAIRNYIAKIAFNKIVLIATHVVSDVEWIAREILILKKGVLVDCAPPHELTRKIEEKVWIVPCAEAQVQGYQDRFRVTNISRDEQTGEVLLRVLADGMPAEGARAARPTLEDYYLTVFGEASGGEEAPRE
jgi:ABC-type multidrug transport system ATPase subunit